MHLTGIQANGFTASEFYRACIDRRLRSKDISFALNGTTPLKLKILPQLMQLHKCSKMVGESLVTGNVLYTEKVVGNVVASMGFVLDKNHKKSYYVPNTILNKDIRELSSTTPKRILAVLKKESSENTYNSLVYLAKSILISDLVFAGKKYETFKQQIDSLDFPVASKPSGC